jgi:SecD/SecF fusion protein
VVVQGGNKIRVQLPGETNPDEALAQITRVAMLEFRLIAEENDTLVGPDGMVDREAFEALNDPDLEILPSKIAVQGEAGDLEYRENEMVVERTVHVSGSNVENAQPYISQTSGLWEISLTFDRTGMVTFGRLTEDNPDRLLAIVLDGTVRSFPQINEPILGGRATISGNFTRDEAFTLTRVINTGALPVKLKAESSQVIGATLGSDSIRKSIVALGMGSAVIIAFICVYYGAAGIVAVIGLLINILAILALIAAGRGTLTLSGIGGVLLTLGMAVDANVLIYERIREELRHGKNAVDAIISGFDSAFYTIVDANVTTLITALILLQFGQGSVQGFALTMTFGIFATLFTGLYVTRTLFGLFFEKRQKAPLGALTIFREPKIRFIEKRAFGYIISTVVILAGIASVIQHGGLIPGTEFSGGVKMQVSFEDTDLGTGDLREAFVSEDERLSTIEVVEILGSDDFVVTSKLLGEGENQLAETTALLEGALEKNFPDAHVILSRDEIGNEVGAEFTSRAITSLIFASLGILFYVALRFEFWFGIAAVIALLHDVLITLGVLTFLDVEITLEVVAALLVVVGYSINDTIVIFDRVRENARLHRGRSYDSIINLSINESLNRTVVTSITTLIVILAMLIFGGAGLYYFALTLLIGLITGTYSSSFVASPFLAYFMRRQGGVALPDVPEKQVKKEKPAPAPAPEDFEDDEDDEEDDEGELAAVGADAAPASAPAKKPARPKAPTKTKKSGKKRPPTRKGGGGKRRKKK